MVFVKLALAAGATSLVLLTSACAVEDSTGGRSPAGGGNRQPVTDRCETVAPKVLKALAQGLEGEEPGESSAVRSDDFDRLWFVAVEVNAEVGVWATATVPHETNILEIHGFMAIDEIAQRTSDWGHGDTTDENVTMSDDGAQEAKDCVEG